MDNPTNFVKRGSFWSNMFKAQSDNVDMFSVLKSMPPFCKLRAKYLRQLIDIMHDRVYHEGETIFYKGDPGIGLYIIRDGEVSINQGDVNDESQELTTLSRGDFFGELAMLDDEIRSATAIAKTDSNISVIFKPDLDEFIKRNPSQGVLILTGLSNIITVRLRKINEDYLFIYNQYLKLQNGSNHVEDSKDISTD